MSFLIVESRMCYIYSISFALISIKISSCVLFSVLSVILLVASAGHSYIRDYSKAEYSWNSQSNKAYVSGKVQFEDNTEVINLFIIDFNKKHESKKMPPGLAKRDELPPDEEVSLDDYLSDYMEDDEAGPLNYFFKFHLIILLYNLK